MLDIALTCTFTSSFITSRDKCAIKTDENYRRTLYLSLDEETSLKGEGKFKAISWVQERFSRGNYV